MSTQVKSLVLGAVTIAAWLTGTTASAQYPNFNPNIAQQQYFNNAARALYAQQTYGGNNFVPVFGSGNLYAPSLPGVGGWGPGTVGVDPFSQGYLPIFDPWGGQLRGAADYMRAFGQTVINIEQARSLRESALQARLDTKKKAFDTEMYIKANTPTYTEEQAKIARTTLRRIQSYSTTTEIVNSKALNFLLDDMRRFAGKKAAMEPLMLSEDILKQINVVKSSGTNFGLLRDAGKINFPIALLELLSPAQQKEIESLTETLFQSALKGKISINALKDLRTNLDQVRETLSQKVNEIPTSQFLEAKRFLNDFDEARAGLEKGEAGSQLKFREFAAGGKNVQEFSDFMVANGFRIAPAITGDEAAYRALYSALAALNIAVNTQYSPLEVKDGPLPPP